MVAPYYKPEMIGSAPYCAEVAEWLVERGWMVRVLTARPRYPSAADFPEYRDGTRDDETVRGVRVTRLLAKPRRNDGAVARFRGDLEFAVRGIAAITRGRRRAAHVVAFAPSIFAIALGLALRRRGGRLVAVVHDIESGLANGLGMIGGGTLLAALQWVERQLLNRADAVVVLTPQMADELRRNRVSSPITVLPIWASPVPPEPSEARLGRAVTVMYSGALGRKQGLHQVIGVAKRLQRSHPGVRVVIRGAGSEGRALALEAAAHGLRNVDFADLVPKDQLFESLRAADIHLVPQDARTANYAVPSKIASIMAAGRPFVCTAVPGSALDELVRASGAGLRVSPDPEELHAGVAALLDDSARRAELGAAGARYVAEQLSATSILTKYEALIRHGTAVSERAGSGENVPAGGAPPDAAASSLASV